MNKMIKIELPLTTKSKKNHQQILINSKTHKPFVAQGKWYKEFEKECWAYLQKYSDLLIDYPVNLKCTFVVPDRRKRDLVNLLNSIQDILVKYHNLKDDNYNIVHSLDGSRIENEKNIEKTIIEISKIEDEN